MTAAVQLERLYRHAGNEEALTNLENVLFSAKGDAYVSMTFDYAAVHRLHIVLGTFYEDDDIWDSDEPSENATFHFREAIRVARRQAESTGILHPFPEMSKKVAYGLRIQRQPDDAQAWDVDAASDYLDVDALDEADAALKRAAADRAHPDAAFDVIRDILRKITDFREAIPNLKTTRDVALPRLPESDRGSFVARQKFKWSVDLARRATELGETEQATRFYVAAFQEAAALRTLSGAEDVLRLDEVRSAIETQRWRGRMPIVAAEKEWLIVGSGAVTLRVAWPATLVETANHAVEAMAPQSPRSQQN